MTIENAFDVVDPSAPDFNMADVFEHWARVQPDALAVGRAEGTGADGRSVFGSRTFAEMNAEADRWAHALREQGVRAGDRVLIFIVDPIDFVTAIYACQKAQAIWVLIDPGMGVKNVLECVGEQEPVALIGIAKAQVLARVFGKTFRTLKARLLVGGSWFPGARSLPRLAERVAAEGPPAREPRAPDETTAIVYTSGSTGVPKGVVFTNTMIATQLRAMRDMLDLLPGEVHVACYPGFSLFAASLGMGVVVPDMDITKPAQANPERVLDAIRTFEARSAFASPALWDPFSRYVDANNIELPTLTRVMTAGAPAQPALLERMIAALPNGDFFAPYGATEALPLSVMSAREILASTAAETRRGAGTCVGKPLEDVTVRAIRVTDEPIERYTPDLDVPTGEVGELIVKAPWISRRYDQRPRHNELSKMESEDGRWYHRMGDVGRIDERGRIWFCGRKSHRVQTRSGTLFSVPVEAIFENHPLVYRAALTWVGQAPEQTPFVAVELEPSCPREADEVIDELRELAREHHHTADIVFFAVHPGFPVDRRHNAKIEREKLAEWAAQRLEREAA